MVEKDTIGQEEETGVGSRKGQDTVEPENHERKRSSILSQL